MTWTLALDLLLAFGLTARLTRLIVSDDIGQWWVKDPLDAWFHAKPGASRRMRFHRYLSGLECPWCVGFWLAGLSLLTLWLAGGVGHAHEAWRYVAGAFALNWLVAHIGVRLGDSGYADPEPEPEPEDQR